MAGQVKIGAKRPAKGVGSIRERSPGHYELRVYDRAAERQIVRTYVATRPDAGIREARRQLAKLVAQVAEGKVGARQKATLAELLDRWLAHLRSVGRAETTMYKYEARARRFAQSRLGRKAVGSISAADLDGLYATWRQQGASAADIAAQHRVVRAALNQAMKWDLVTRNPATLATVSTPPRPEMTLPTPEHAMLLLTRAAASRTPDLGPILLLAMLTGCRRGELCGLMWSDVDFERNRVTFKRSIYEVAGQVGVKGTKTNRARTISLDPVGMGLLAARRQRAEADARAAGIELEDGFVWSTTVDASTPREPDGLSKAFASLCEALERETGDRFPYHLHLLRHLSASELIASGADVRTVAGRLGHADATTTLRVYSHFFEARDQEAALALGQRFAFHTTPDAKAGSRAQPTFPERQLLPAIGSASDGS